MALQHRTFWRSKGDAGSWRCEDAFEADPQAGRFAVADGATESDFTDTWARLLVERFVRSADPNLVPWASSWLNDVRKHWLDDVQFQLAVNFEDGELPWYVEAGLRRGAFATFLGLVVVPNDGGYQWRATAVGDTCLFHTREDRLLRVFPIEQANQFNCSPRLLASCAESGGQKGLAIKGSGQPRDQLWIATDALAEWCLVEEEANRGPWQKLQWLLQPAGTNERFALWVERMRSKKRLRNDDVTLLIISL